MSTRLFPYPRRTETSLAGFVLGRAEVLFGCDPHGIRVIERAEALPRDVHHAFVKVDGDDRLLRVIVAPVEEPIELFGRPVSAIFEQPEEAEHGR